MSHAGDRGTSGEESRWARTLIVVVVGRPGAYVASRDAVGQYMAVDKRAAHER